jgi:hypothetical protein
MKEYFNLNERARKAWNNNGGTAVVTGLPDVFPETGNHLEWDSVTEEVMTHLSLVSQVLMYLGIFIGILLSTAVTHFRSGNADITITLGEVVVSAVIALVIIPVVYEKLQLNPEAPFIVQFGLFVQHGVFWHVLIDSIGSAI